MSPEQYDLAVLSYLNSSTGRNIAHSLLTSRFFGPDSTRDFRSVDLQINGVTNPPYFSTIFDVTYSDSNGAKFYASGVAFWTAVVSVTRDQLLKIQVDGFSLRDIDTTFRDKPLR